MNKELYLQRISYSGKVEPSLEALGDLQKAHLLTVPFENLDIHYGRKIDPANTFDKVVHKGRGGFCYELNSLFYELLKIIGYSAKLVSARVYDPQSGFSPEFDHMAIIVHIDGIDYLVDVGFGEFAFSPLKIEAGLMQVDSRGTFVIQKYNDTHWLVIKEEAQAIPQYIFSETERQINEFRERCIYHQTSPDSHFTQKRLCSLPTQKGRISITGNKLKIKENNKIKETILKDEVEFNNALREYFKIRL